MIKNWLRNKGNKKGPDQIIEWKTNGSILDFISSQIDTEGKLKDTGQDLPDEDRDENKVRYAPGLMDAMFGVDDSEDAKKRVVELSSALKRIATKGDKTSEYEFYKLITENDGAIGIIDEFLKSVIDERLPVEPHLFDFAKNLATKANHRNCVKFGIALLGLCQNKTVLDELRILGLHDEFTIYSTIAIANLSNTPVLDLWELAKKVNGWGKIQLVDRLANMELTNEIKDWLVRDGYKNRIMYEYLAFTCATRGRLHERLAIDKIDKGLFKSAGEIIDALIMGGPAEDISSYVHASTVVKDYIRHAKEYTSSISDFLTLHRIKDFLQELQTDLGKHQENGWTQDMVEKCLIEVVTILDSRDWQQPTLEGLKSKDNVTYWDAKQAATRLGIDVWDAVWQRLTEKTLESSSWYDVTHYAKPDKADQIVEFALNNLPLEECATGPKDSMGLGPDYNKFHCLEYVITFLENYPAKGERIILTGLRSPVTRNRNMALRVLAKWGRGNWSEELTREINYLKAIEPNKETKETIEQLLDK